MSTKGVPRLPQYVFSPRLSARQAEVLSLLAAGLPVGEVASALFVSERTVKWHVETISAKCGRTGLRAVVAFYYRLEPRPDLFPAPAGGKTL